MTWLPWAIWVFLSIIGWVALGRFLRYHGPQRHDTVQTVAAQIRGHAANIVRLHREIGIDPLYDPTYDPVITGVAPVVDAEAEPLLVRVCRRCGDQVVGNAELSRKLMRLHMQFVHHV